MKLYIYIIFLAIVSLSCGNSGKAVTAANSTKVDESTRIVTTTAFETAKDVLDYIADLEADFNDDINSYTKLEGTTVLKDLRDINATIYADKDNKPQMVSYTFEDEGIKSTYDFLYQDNKLVYVNKGQNKFILDGKTLVVWLRKDTEIKKFLADFGDIKSASMIQEAQSVFISLTKSKMRR